MSVKEEPKYNIEQLRKEFSALRKYAAIQAAQEDKIGVQKIYVDITGDIKAAFVLDELIFWTLPREKKNSGLRVWKDGVLWLAVSRSEWWDRKRLTERQADRAIDKLIEQKLIVKKVFKYNNAPTLHLRLNIPMFFEKYAKALAELHPPENDQDTIQKDLADLYQMMGFPISPFGKLPNGDTESPNGENNNIPHTSLTKEEEEGKAFAAFENNISPLTPMLAESVGNLIDEHTPGWVIKAIEEAVANGKRNLKYIKAILDRWKVEGYGTPYPKKKGKTNGKATTTKPDYENDGWEEKYAAIKERGRKERERLEGKDQLPA